MRAVGHGDVVPDRLPLRRQLLHQRREAQVEEDDLVLGMVDDVAELIGEEARVDGVADGADAGDAEIELVMAVAVPGEGPDAIADADAEPLAAPSPAAWTRRSASA